MKQMGISIFWEVEINKTSTYMHTRTLCSRRGIKTRAFCSASENGSEWTPSPSVWSAYAPLKIGESKRARSSINTHHQIFHKNKLFQYLAMIIIPNFMCVCVCYVLWVIFKVPCLQPHPHSFPPKTFFCYKIKFFKKIPNILPKNSLTN